MKYMPILFSTPMVQALLEDRKTMTRRIIKPQPDPEGDGVQFIPIAPSLDWELYFREEWKPWHWDTDQGERISKFCPYGQPGDVLWVRETWRGIEQDFGQPRYEYKATETVDLTSKWQPSIFMPKQACRIFLEITDVRVERLQEISERDVKREGVGGEVRQMWLFGADQKGRDEIYRRSFERLWLKINGQESWNKNLWVWVISFKRIEKPEGFNN